MDNHQKSVKTLSKLLTKKPVSRLAIRRAVAYLFNDNRKLYMMNGQLTNLLKESKIAIDSFEAYLAAKDLENDYSDWDDEQQEETEAALESTLDVEEGTPDEQSDTVD